MSMTRIPACMIEIAITAPGGPEVLKPQHVAVPQPRAGELLVRVMAAGVNRPDVMQRRGEYPMPTGVTRTPGLEVAGQVVALGDGVAGFAIGDLICGLTNGGGYAEYCVLPAVQALPVPPGLDAVRAAAIPETFFTVWANVFGIGRVVEGEFVLVHGGTSGIGSTALMLCKEFGVRACATDDGPQKCEAALALGAERAVDFRSQDFVDAVHEWTEGRGVDAVVDIVGGAYYERNITALAKDGRLVLIGFLGGEIAEKVNLLTIALKRLTISGSTMRARTTAEKAAIAAEMHEKIWPAMAAGRCLPSVNAVFPLEKAADAHRFMESGGHVGKIVLQVGS